MNTKGSIYFLIKLARIWALRQISMKAPWFFATIVPNFRAICSSLAISLVWLKVFVCLKRANGKMADSNLVNGKLLVTCLVLGLPISRLLALFYITYGKFACLRKLCCLVALMSIIMPYKTMALGLDIWEAGRLDYAYGGAEVAAFVNTKEQIQLQIVLCSKDQPYAFRMSVLLPHKHEASGIIPVRLNVDGQVTNVYAEVSGNSLEFQVGTSFLITLPDSPNFEMEFSKEDSSYLKIPQVLSFSMSNANLVLSEVAKSCVILQERQGFKSNEQLLSGILWPRQGFNSLSLTKKNNHLNDSDKYRNIESLCLRSNKDGNLNNKVVTGLVSSIHDQDSMPMFYPSKECKKALDDIYEAQGKLSLSFLPELFKNPTGHYQRYIMLWNNVLVDTSRMDFKHVDKPLDDFDYYLTLFSLFSDSKISQYPQSYYDILKLKEDPSTFLYTMDNRYELETVKYASVLTRRLTSFLSPRQNSAEAISAWHQFYQELSLLLPPISKAQAIRPVLYRQMLMRIWRLAGYPDPLHLRPKYAFVQGTNGKTTTKEPLEARCSIFEGSNGDQFFFASNDCVKSITTDLRNLGMINNDYYRVLDCWDDFAKAWTKSNFYHTYGQDAVGEHLRSSLALTLLSLYKNYGFGDYFLLNKCISSRDSDICAYEANNYYESYSSDLRKTIAAIAKVSNKDARELKKLNDLWSNYYDSLKVYTKNLANKNRIPLWKSEFILGVAVTCQSEAILNSRYNRDGIETSISDDFQG